MKMSTEEILEEVNGFHLGDNIEEFIFPLDLTDEQFEILSENVYIDVKRAIAKHPALPEYFKYKLTEDEMWEVRRDIALRPDLTEDLMYKLTEDEEQWVRFAITKRSDLSGGLLIKLSCDPYRNTMIRGFGRLEKFNTLKSEDHENAYDFIRISKYIGRKYFERTFNYIISNFPELSEAAKLFKSIILKGKKDLL
jgi:hypothetical protein